MRNSPYGITVPFRANATINKFRVLRYLGVEEIVDILAKEVGQATSRGNG